MKKLFKIGVHTAFFMLGVILALYSANFFQQHIINIYKSIEVIKFTGKFFSFWSFSYIYWLSFGFVFLLLSFELFYQKIGELVINLLAQISLFFFIFYFSTASSIINILLNVPFNDNGTLSICYGKIPFVFILTISILGSSIPTIIRIFKHRMHIKNI